MKNLILASTSTIYSSGYLEYILPNLEALFANVSTVLFIPYARPSGMSYNNYTDIASKGLAPIHKKVIGLHEFDSKVEAINNAEAIFVGGGNTFVLLKELQAQNLLGALKNVLNSGTPYLGTSAGSNIACLTVQNTNDMPIVYPKNLKGMELIPFNINAHYLDADPSSTHKGESRETRIKEYHVYNDLPVLGLREGSWLRVNGNKIELKGELSARWFEKDKKPVELEAGYKF